MTPGAQRIIAALDTADPHQALRWGRALRGRVGAVKIGLELVHAAGPSILARIREESGHRVFYDSKFADIPNTVAAAARQAVLYGVWMFNVHVLCGRRVMEAALRAVQPSGSPLVIGVTLLTSLSPQEIAEEVGLTGDPTDHVVRLARLAQSVGLPGVIASAQEARAIRAACGPDFLIVTPGVRPAGIRADDQVRVATPTEAIRAGADYLVVGRPITGAEDFVAAAEAIAAEVDAALAEQG